MNGDDEWIKNILEKTDFTIKETFRGNGRLNNHSINKHNITNKDNILNNNNLTNNNLIKRKSNGKDSIIIKE